MADKVAIGTLNDLIRYIVNKPLDSKGRLQVTFGKGHPYIKDVKKHFTLAGFRVTCFYSTYSVTMYFYSE